MKASSGRIVRILVQGTEFAQCVFAGNRLFSANDNGVFAWRLKQARAAAPIGRS